MTRELTPREAGSIFVTSDGEVFDYEGDAAERFARRMAEGERTFAEQCEQARRENECDTPEKRAQAAADQSARRTDAWAAHRAFAHLRIAPTRCSINWWGNPAAGGHIDVHIPGRRIVRVEADGACSGGEPK